MTGYLLSFKLRITSSENTSLHIQRFAVTEIAMVYGRDNKARVHCIAYGLSSGLLVQLFHYLPLFYLAYRATLTGDPLLFVKHRPWCNFS
jgi:hypothetical protein